MPLSAPPPRLSVILVNYNAGPLLTEAVASVLAGASPLEVLVSDNGSWDGSLRLLEATFGQRPELRILRQGRNLGFAAANNRAIEQARGDWLLFLNPDCVLHPQASERLLQALAANPAAGMAGARLRNPDGSEQRGCRRNLPSLGRSLGKALGIRRWNRMDLQDAPLPAGPQAVEAISGACMLVRRAALEAVGPWDEGFFLHCEDLDWCARFQAKGWRILFVPAAEVTHRQGACSRHRPLFVEWHKHLGMARYFRKHTHGGMRLWTPLVYAGILARFALVAARGLLVRPRPPI